MCVSVHTHACVCVCVGGYTCLSVCACVFRIFCCWYNSLLVSTRGTAVVEHDNISEIRYEIAEAQQLTSSSFRYRGIELCLIILQSVCLVYLTQYEYLKQPSLLEYSCVWLVCFVCTCMCVCVHAMVHVNQ